MQQSNYFWGEVEELGAAGYWEGEVRCRALILILVVVNIVSADNAVVNVSFSILFLLNVF